MGEPDSDVRLAVGDFGNTVLLTRLHRVVQDRLNKHRAACRTVYAGRRPVACRLPSRGSRPAGSPDRRMHGLHLADLVTAAGTPAFSPTPANVAHRPAAGTQHASGFPGSRPG